MYLEGLQGTIDVLSAGKGHNLGRLKLAGAYVCVTTVGGNWNSLDETAKDLNILFIIHDFNSDKIIQPNVWDFP